MISVTRLNGKRLTVNALLIETIEETPDTLITLTTGKKIMVRESVSDVVSLAHAFLQTLGFVQSTIKRVDSEGS